MWSKPPLKKQKEGTLSTKALLSTCHLKKNKDLAFTSRQSKEGPSE